MTPGWLYLYCVAEEPEEPGRFAPAGLPVPLVTVAGHGLLVCARGGDPDEIAGLEAAARAEAFAALDGPLREHLTVIAALFGHGPVLPFRFGTLIAAEAEVRRLLAARHRDWRAELRSLEGHREWGVKFGLLPVAHSPARVAVASGAGAGAAYLLQRSRERLIRRQGEDRRRALVGDGHKQLAALTARSLVTGKGLAPDLPEVPELGAAYLVAEGQEARFLETAGSLAELLKPEQIHLRLTGPWPPFSFCGIGSNGPSPSI